MSDDVYNFAQRLRKRAKEKIAANHSTMDSGVAPDQYNRLVGRNAQIKELLTWINEESKGLELEQDDDL